MVKRLLSVGECLIEFYQLDDASFGYGFAGDTFATAVVARHCLGTGWRVACLTALGTDVWSDRILAHMKAVGIETDHVARLPERSPGLRILDTIDGPPRTSAWCEQSAARALADDPDALEAAISSANAVFFSGVTLAILAPDARGQLLSALDRAKARGATVAFDSKLHPGLWPDRGALRAAIRAAARVSTIALPPGADEAELFGEAGAEAVADRYVGDGCAEVLVRAPSGAALLRWPGGQTVPAPAARRIRSADAADIFNGTYLAARVTGAAPEEALRRATEAAAGAEHDEDAVA